MIYDDYLDIVLYLTGKENASFMSLSSFLKKPTSNVISLLEQLSDIGCPFKITDNVSLLSVPDVYSIDDIRSGCNIADQAVSVFLSIDSTNSYLKSISNAENKLLVCIAEFQTQGRGRRGKNWVSPFGSNLYFSIRQKLEVPVKTCGCISLIAGISIIKALEDLNYTDLKIKWPNDIYFQNKKLAGVLIEVVSVKADSIDVVIGIGLNVNMPSLSAKNIDQPWVDLSQFPGITLPSRNSIVISLLKQLNLNLSAFEKEGAEAFQADWKKYDLLSGQKIEIKQENGSFFGEAAGINEIGELQVLGDNGIQSINAGEVSVRAS